MQIGEQTELTHPHPTRRRRLFSSPLQAHLKNYCMSVCASGGDAHAARTSEASMRRLRNDMYRRERNHP